MYIQPPSDQFKNCVIPIQCWAIGQMLGIYHIPCIPRGNPRALQMASNPKNKATPHPNPPTRSNRTGPTQSCWTPPANAFGCFNSCTALSRPSCALTSDVCVNASVCFAEGGGALCMCALTVCVCMHAAICITQAIRKTSFTASVKLARGSPQDVHTQDLPIVNRLNSVSLNLLATSLALPLVFFLWWDASEFAQRTSSFRVLREKLISEISVRQDLNVCIFVYYLDANIFEWDYIINCAPVTLIIHSIQLLLPSQDGIFVFLLFCFLFLFSELDNELTPYGIFNSW